MRRRPVQAPVRLAAPVARRLLASARACAAATARLCRRRRVAAMAALMLRASPAGKLSLTSPGKSRGSASGAPAARLAPAWRASLAGSSPAGALLSAPGRRGAGAAAARRRTAPRASALVVAAAGDGDASKAVSAPPAAAATAYTPQVRAARGGPRTPRAAARAALSRRRGSRAHPLAAPPRRTAWRPHIGRGPDAAAAPPARQAAAAAPPRFFGASRNRRGPKPRTVVSCSLVLFAA